MQTKNESNQEYKVPEIPFVYDIEYISTSRVYSFLDYNNIRGFINNFPCDERGILKLSKPGFHSSEPLGEKVVEEKSKYDYFTLMKPCIYYIDFLGDFGNWSTDLNGYIRFYSSSSYNYDFYPIELNVSIYNTKYYDLFSKLYDELWAEAKRLNKYYE